MKYKIQDEAETGRLFEIRSSSSECLVGCVCRMFEFRGILCRHALFVLFQECVTVLPDRYILDKWRKDIKKNTPISPLIQMMYNITLFWKGTRSCID